MQMRAQTRMDLEGIAPHAAEIWDVLKRYQMVTQRARRTTRTPGTWLELTRLTDPQIEQAKRYAVMACAGGRRYRS